MQIVFDLYHDREITTYQSRGRAMAAQARHPGSVIKRREVRHGESPRWRKPAKKPSLGGPDGRDIGLAFAAAELLFGRRP